MYIEAKENYYKSQRNLAAFIDANMNVVSAEFKTTQEKLQNEANLAYAIYNQMAQQLQMAKVKVQDTTPVFTIIEPAKMCIRDSDGLDKGAESIGAVNVVKVIREKDNATRLIGYNSDIIGFQESIRPLINTAIHKKALILGTGGASKAVKGALDALGIEWIYVSRTPSEGQLSYSDIDSHVMEEYTVIVHTSPLGTFPDVDNAPDIPYTCLLYTSRCV